MNKNDSLVIKGIAILMMLWLHLFNTLALAEQATNLIRINGLPLAHLLSNAVYPVPFYLFIGGYGMYQVCKAVDRNKWKRVIALYINHLCILFTFLTLYVYTHNADFPSISTLIYGLIGYEYTLNPELWFLLPYCILTISSSFIFKKLERYSPLHIIIVFLIIHLGTSYIISRHGSFFYDRMYLYNPLLVLHISFNFILGAMCARMNVFEQLKSKVSQNVFLSKHLVPITILTLLTLVVIQCIFKYNYFYAFLFITCVVICPRPMWLDRILMEFGNKSTGMWMIHSWWFRYIFHDFIYSFKYPISIWLALVVCSYICAVIMSKGTSPLIKSIYSDYSTLLFKFPAKSKL